MPVLEPGKPTSPHAVQNLCSAKGCRSLSLRSQPVWPPLCARMGCRGPCGDASVGMGSNAHHILPTRETGIGYDFENLWNEEGVIGKQLLHMLPS